MIWFRQLIDDERGFLGTYILILYLFFLLMGFALLIGLFTAMQSSATRAYQWFDASGQYTIRLANMQGITSDPEANLDVAEQYFDAAYAELTKTTWDGSEFEPGPGCPFPGPVTVTEFDPVDQGGALPGGGTAGGPGYLIGISVPDYIGNVPCIGQQSVSVPMRKFFQLGSS